MVLPVDLQTIQFVANIVGLLGAVGYARKLANNAQRNSRLLLGEPDVESDGGVMGMVYRHEEELDEIWDRFDPSDNHDLRADGSATPIPPDILHPPSKLMNKRAKAASSKQRYAISKTVLQGLIIPMAVFAAQQASTGDYATAAAAGTIVLIAYVADLAIGLEAIPWEEDQLVDAAERLGANYEDLADWANRKAYGD